jgi:beta-galactosidase
LLRQQSDPQLIANAIQEELEAIERDRNHPSLALWSVGNENMTLSFFRDSRALHRQVIAAVRRFDPSRLVTFAVITAPTLSPRFEGVADLADVISVNEYFGWYFGKMEQVGPYFDRIHRKWPNKPVLISEFGADAIPGKHAPAGAEPEKFTEEYQVKMLTHTWAEIQKRDFIVGGMLWAFADFRCGWSGRMHPTFHMNEKGVVTYQREKKPGYEALKRIYQEIEKNGPYTNLTSVVEYCFGCHWRSPQGLPVLFTGNPAKCGISPWHPRSSFMLHE